MRSFDVRQNENVSATVERVSRRFQNGVSIIERETITTVAVGEEAPAAPRLVVEDPASKGEVFIARSRSEVLGLLSLLKSLSGPALSAL
jgi:hypothetical protein